MIKTECKTTGVTLCRGGPYAGAFPLLNAADGARVVPYGPWFLISNEIARLGLRAI